MTARLSDEEFWYLLQMLQRCTETDMDQWDRWRLRTACGPVYVRISRRLPQDEPEQAFRALEVPLAARYRTGRPARVSDPGLVSTRAGLVRITEEMGDDRACSGRSHRLRMSPAPASNPAVSQQVQATDGN